MLKVLRKYNKDPSRYAHVVFKGSFKQRESGSVLNSRQKNIQGPNEIHIEFLKHLGNMGKLAVFKQPLMDFLCTCCLEGNHHSKLKIINLRTPPSAEVADSSNIFPGITNPDHCRTISFSS